MDYSKLRNVKIGKEELVRALTDPSTTPFTTYDIEELEKTSLITTPVFTPLLTKLRTTAKRSRSWRFEWDEVTTQTDHTQVKYNGNTLPSDTQGTPARPSNIIMPAATVARVSRFAQSFETIDGDAMKIELTQKYIDLTKGVEYYLWNGDDDVTGVVTETDGIIKLVTTSVSNGGGALLESILQTAIIQCYAEGAVPDMIYCTPVVAQRIANFVDPKLALPSNTSATNGVGVSAFTYISPFGFRLTVQPVLQEFIGTGKVYVIDSTKLEMKYSSPSVLSSEPLSVVQHGMATIMFSFFGLQVKAATKYHRKITNVAESL